MIDRTFRREDGLSGIERVGADLAGLDVTEHGPDDSPDVAFMGRERRFGEVSVRAAPIARVIPLIAPVVLGLPGAPFHEPFHGRRRASSHRRNRASRPGLRSQRCPLTRPGTMLPPGLPRVLPGPSEVTAPAAALQPAISPRLARTLAAPAVRGPHSRAGPGPGSAPAGTRNLRRSAPDAAPRRPADGIKPAAGDRTALLGPA
jgi:hypothetical protein